MAKRRQTNHVQSSINYRSFFSYISPLNPVAHGLNSKMLFSSNSLVSPDSLTKVNITKNTFQISGTSHLETRDNPKAVWMLILVTNLKSETLQWSFA